MASSQSAGFVGLLIDKREVVGTQYPRLLALLPGWGVLKYRRLVMMIR